MCGCARRSPTELCLTAAGRAVLQTADGGVAARAGLSDAAASELLIQALPSGKSWDVARRTIAWGLAAGRDRPISLPDRHEGRAAA